MPRSEIIAALRQALYDLTTASRDPEPALDELARVAEALENEEAEDARPSRQPAAIESDEVCPF
jgi:hypothetical protein